MELRSTKTVIAVVVDVVVVAADFCFREPKTRPAVVGPLPQQNYRPTTTTTANQEYCRAAAAAAIAHSSFF